MTEQTLKELNRAYIRALELSTESVTEITENFYHSLSAINKVDKRDQLQFDNFFLGIERCLEERRLTFEVTNICVEILYTAMMIHLWLNVEKGYKLDVNYNGRRKSLDSEYSKLLHKASKNEFCSINDRFGIRAIIMDDDISAVYALSNTVLGILTRLNRVERIEFQNWLYNTKEIDAFSKDRVNKVLKIHFEVDTDKVKDTKDFNAKEHPDVVVPAKSESRYSKLVKDYMHTPKGNGYQSLHYVLRISALSEILPGVTIEFQFRTVKMHMYAMCGKAAHAVYKQQKLEETEAKVNVDADNLKDEDPTFIVGDEVLKRLHIKGFLNYVDSETDVDGLHFGKLFYNRRLSPNIKLC